MRIKHTGYKPKLARHMLWISNHTFINLQSRITARTAFISKYLKTYYVHYCRTDLQTFIALELAQVLLQEQQVDAEVVIATSAGVQPLGVAEGGQEPVRAEQLAVLPLADGQECCVDHHGNEQQVDGHVDAAEQAEDAHGHQLTRHRGQLALIQDNP